MTLKELFHKLILFASIIGIVISIYLRQMITLGFSIALFIVFVYNFIIEIKNKKYSKYDYKYVRKLCKKGNFIDAVKYIDLWIKSYPDNHVLYNEKGYVLMMNKEAAEALSLFYKSVELIPENKKFNAAFNNICWACNEIGEYETAIKYADKSLSIDPSDYITMVNKGNALISIEKYQEALECYNMSLNVKENYAHALYGKGLVYYTIKEYDNALINFKKYAEIAQKDIDGYAYLARIFAIKEMHKEQIEMYDKILKLNDKLTWVYCLKGDALCYLGEFEKALAEFDKAIFIDCKCADAYYYKSRIFAYSRHRDDAFEALRMAIELDPDYKEIALNDVALNNIKIFREFNDTIQ